MIPQRPFNLILLFFAIAAILFYVLGIPRHPPTTQPALGFTFAPSRDNTAYAIAAGLLPADTGAPAARPNTPANQALYATTSQRLTALHSTYQAALNSLVDVLDVDPEAGAAVRAADTALRALLKRIDVGRG